MLDRTHAGDGMSLATGDKRSQGAPMPAPRSPALEASPTTTAITLLRETVARDPKHPQAWRQLGDRLDAAGDRTGAARAYVQHVRNAIHDPALMDAAAALHANRLPEAEARLKNHLRGAPTDVVALRMLAELAMRLDRGEDAEHLLRHCLELAPDFHEARHNFALVLNRVAKPRQAVAELDRLLRADPANAAFRNLKAVSLCHTGEYAAAIAIFDGLLRELPRHAPIWLSYAHALKTAGEQDRAIEAYLQCIELNPDFGDAYWSLANLKTFRFSAAQIASMRAALERSAVPDEQRLCLEFALGKALEDAAEYADSFRHYETANALRLRLVPYSADDTAQRLRRSREVYTAEFFGARSGGGCAAPDPIFIVGLPRAGSTLIEQILSSHSLVEGTMELPDLISITRNLRRSAADAGAGTYHDALARLSGDELRGLGEEYLARTRPHRKLGRPFFIDKMPNNFAHIGLIHLILPNAKIIDARRHPLACCFSAFKQHFAHGQNFTYGLENIGRYYRDYADYMRHVDAVLPARVHRVHYEDMVADTEHEVRRLLAYCDLPFEESCLRFFENERPVRTASSEQVRQPIYRSGVDHWQNFEPWLGPLKAALGPALTDYRSAMTTELGTA
jgi:tetratricopeptide (TPR) repeat protein